jgi:hypothetical protein
MYRKSRRTIALDAKRARCAAMRAAKERKRLDSCGDSGSWPLVRAVWLAVYAAPDGRYIEIHAASDRGHWQRCGSERAVRGAVSTILWGMRGMGGRK